ncbi:hydrogenase 4 subunit F (plasmid) [Azospirillum sp. TSH58]|uniref:hydrogenase 4 subunit F n=1 Tax=Azospirillum sp. TSH58 TaxID=664962 RepID=UPI000D5FEF54|nr:hydrogenase 4 subunit F [Azospirillum sp. TSH58]AWJ86137.1 hydrogenase 4 subunit F [Azospirillum sp. TSH58]PWC71658.1 hydrogenase 4 subunit F [Azospirillum sp. TSH58]
MSAVAVIVATPLIGAAVLALIPGHRLGARLNIGFSAVTLLASLVLFGMEPSSGALFVVDAFNIYLIALTAFVGLTTSVFSAGYIAHEIAARKLDERKLRFYHAMYQAFMFTMLLALSANNLGVMWVAVEGATLTTVLMVSLYRTAASIEAAWKYFILCGVGIALALFGTILMYMAAQPVMGPGMAAMTWTELMGHVAKISPAILNLAFVFLLIGYGTKVGLAPLHAWLPDAHAEGPTPISAVLSGLLLNVALYAVLRFKMLLAANGQAIAPGPLMIAMGLASLLLAGLMLYRRRDVKRFFAYSSIEHMGIITFAFGMGGPLANFAGLLHMAMHSLTKSAIFYAVGHAVQVTGSQRIDRISGLTVSHPALGWGLLAGVVAIAGLPPFGVFMSEFLLVTSTFARQPLLALPLVVGILVAFGALVLRVQQLCFGAPGTVEGSGVPVASVPLQGTLVPLYAHLVLVLVAGVWLPGPLVAWFQTVAALLG